jgi:hypothetical protein
VREALRRVPPGAWLATIVVVSAGLRLAFVRGMPAPFIFVDELIYSELARSLADGTGYAVRGVETSGYSLLYPLLIAPAYAIDDLVTAHSVAQAVNAAVMSLAALPAYALARRIATPGGALLVALGAVAVPSMAYVGTITTESLFYPVALVVALTLVRYLEQPSAGRTALLLVALAVAFATRSQALAFLPAVLTAPLVLAVLRGRRGELRRLVPIGAVLMAGLVAVLVAQAVRGRSPLDLLGSYSIVGESSYDVGQVLRYWLWESEELVLYLAAVPVAVLVVLLAGARNAGERLQEHLAATVSLGVWSLAVVGAFTSRFASDRVQDRYLFFLAPLLLACVAAWVAAGAPRPRVVAPLAVAATTLLAVAFPYERFLAEPVKSDTLGLVPLLALASLVPGLATWVVVALAGVALAALFLLVPARRSIVVLVAIVGLWGALGQVVWWSEKGFRVASEGALFQGIRSVPRSWIDDAVAGDSEVIALWTGSADRFTVNQNEFFSRAVGRVFYTEQPTPGGLPETKVTAGEDGVYRDARGVPVRAPYALLDQTVVPDGDVVARDEALGMTVWRLTGPLARTTTVTGLYPNDTWSGAAVTWTRLRCRPGILRADLHSDPGLFTTPQRVRATTNGATATVVFPPTRTARLRIPVRPAADGTCVVRYTVTPTAVPADVLPGSSDDRRLGVHFDVLSYTPRP